MIPDGTIAAISTPLGEGGIGIVRLSGAAAIAIVDSFFRPSTGESLDAVPSHTLHHGFIEASGERIDEVLVSVMRAPRTYTREDVVEINCHSGFVASRAILDLSLAAGARLAERGEFTKRAYLNGRISLDQAKSVLDVVRAKTRLGLEAAIDQLGGRFSRSIEEIRDDIAIQLATIEVQIDFPDVEADSTPVLPAIGRLRARIQDLLAQADRGRLLRDGVTAAIIGRPNVGKSTLLNRLLAQERAIVTPIPGTTRDTIEEEVSFDGIPIRLIDTAGLRPPTDAVESEGVRRSEEAIARADLILLVLDRSVPLTDEDHVLLRRSWDRPAQVLLNKSDLPPRLDPSGLRDRKAVLAISSATGEGIDALVERVKHLLLHGEVLARGALLLLDTWEQNLLRRTDGFLAKSAAAIRETRSPDVIAEELRRAHRATGELQGIDLTEAVLDEVFARFCVGK